MILFDHPIWKHIKKYAAVAEGRDNLDFHQLPDQLRALALEVTANCVACGAVVNPLRARAKSERSRIAGSPVERRLFYAPTCLTEKNPGCSRARAARDHKKIVRVALGLPQTSGGGDENDISGVKLPPVSAFSGEYRFLSNFWPARIAYEGIEYPSTEHAYQAAKTLDVGYRNFVAGLSTAAQAKRAGKAAQLRSDWEQVKLQVMEDVLRLKFTDPDLAARLTATRGRELIEGNTWGDRFWGVCGGRGENHLGKLLTKIRDSL